MVEAESSSTAPDPESATAPLAVASAVCAAGSLAIARRAERRELPVNSGHPAMAESIEDEKLELPGRGV